jgi:porphobilinogen deaminase
MNAPHHHFERGGGARQWGVETVVGIPIASPSVGRIVVVLYSRHDREKDQELVGRLSEEFTRVCSSGENMHVSSIKLTLTCAVSVDAIAKMEARRRRWRARTCPSSA